MPDDECKDTVLKMRERMVDDHNDIKRLLTPDRLGLWLKLAVAVAVVVAALLGAGGRL